MIINLKIGNFKCFDTFSLPLAPLTILTGFNAAGKTTSLQSLLLLAQAFRFGRRSHELNLNGPLARLGTPSEVVSSNKSDILFSVEDDAAEVQWSFQPTDRIKGINDLSLDCQFADFNSFKEALEPLLRLRFRNPVFRDCFYCSRLLFARPVDENKNLQQAVFECNDRLFKGQVIDWFSKSGPFWENCRGQVDEDLFCYKEQDVTEQGLGEAARCIISGVMAGVFSFQGASADFGKVLLNVQQGLPDDPIRDIDINNYCRIEQLVNAFQDAKILGSWQDIGGEIRERYDGLLFSEDVIEPLFSTPFSRQVAHNIFERLKVLDQLVAETGENGELTDSGKRLLTKHFVGRKAWFTDESGSNKNSFSAEMTFPDPEESLRRLFCTWHGKIKTPQIRIHFEWPRPTGQKEIKVVYIGPKITKG